MSEKYREIYRLELQKKRLEVLLYNTISFLEDNFTGSLLECNLIREELGMTYEEYAEIMLEGELYVYNSN